ncbi:MAG TPA: restriction endonuclease, SacI family [Solirubrobacterales bacterium]|nr:restriction endonuclease, SacI family [Solirubrobacterales bacterium]
MAVTLDSARLSAVLDQAYLLATSDKPLPKLWLDRAEQLRKSPSRSFIAAFGAALLAKATDARVDSMVIQTQEGSIGAYSLRRAATELAQKRRQYGYDIGSTSDRDPINASTLISSRRWDVALNRITPPHKPFFQVILGWLADLNELSEEEATEALAAFIRMRREVAHGVAAEQVPILLENAPRLADLVEVLEAFSSADTEGGARGMALLAAAFRAAGLEAEVPSRNDPRHIDIPIKLEGKLFIGSEVKQQPTREVTADSLARDCADAEVSWAILAVLPPGILDQFDIASAIWRAEQEHAVILRVLTGVRPILHEASLVGRVSLPDFCAGLPRAYADALRDIRADDSAIETWAAISARWV